MKKNLAKIGLSALITFSSICVTTGTLSWLSYLVSLDNSYASNRKIDGSTLGAYFAYGDGIPTDQQGNHRVYGINKPRHLYNLAWLQYLGYFEKTDNSGNIIQYYFEIDPNLEGELDMSGWTLPPIGTESHPFIGNFNGNGKIISNLSISNEYGNFNTHPSDVTAGLYNQPDIVGFFGVVGNKTGLTGYSSSINEISTLGLKNLTVETTSENTLVGLAAGYVDAEIENVAIENPTLIVSNEDATTYSGSLTNNISDYYAVGYCKDTAQKRYTADISKVTNSIYNVNVSTLQPFTITEQGTNTGWGGSIDMLEMYNKLDEDWNTLNHQYADSPSVNSIAYDSSRTDDYNVDGELTNSSVTGQTNNSMPYDDYGAISNPSNYDDPHAYFNVSKSNSLTNEDTKVSENCQTSSISFVVQTDGTNKATEERFMCLTGRKDVTITDGMTVTTNNYPTFSGKYISTSSGQTRYLTVSNNTTIDNNSTSQTTPWVLDDGLLFTGTSTNQKLYLVCSNTGVLSLNTNEGSASTWTYDTSANSFYTVIGNNTWALTYDAGAWKCQTITIDHYLIHAENGRYLKHNGNANTTLQDNRNYAVADPDLTSSSFWWYKNGDYYRTGANSNYYLVNYNNGGSLRTRNTTNYRLTYDGTYLYNGNYYVYFRSGNNYNYFRLTSNADQRTPMVIEPVYSTTPPSINYAGTGSFKAFSTSVTTEDATLSIPHTYFPLRYEDNSSKPDIKNTGYVVSGGEFTGNPYGDIRVSSYGIEYYLAGVNTTDSTDENEQKYKKINEVYTKTFDANNAYSDTDVNASTFYSDSDRYERSKSALEHVFGGESSAYGFHFMDADISADNPAVAPGAVINGSIYKNLELPTDCIDFHLKEKGVINFFAGSYYTGNTSFFSLYEIDRNDPVSTATIIGTENNITFTYKGFDASKKMKFNYNSDPFNVAGHTFDHVTINGNLVDEEGEPFDITNYPGNNQNYFTLEKGSKKYEYFNIKFYDDQDVCYLDADLTSQRTDINEIRKITKVWSDPSDTEGERSYCYEYKIGDNTRYSVPYRYVMGKKVDLDQNQTPYVEGRVLTDKPSAYTKLEFLMDCIEVGPSGGSLKTMTKTINYRNYTQGYVYYFEVPMNEGEFALGSVDGYDGAYLMYLDIAANASLIKRTEITEHFIFSDQQHKYPLGVAIVLDAEDALAGLTANPVVLIDPTESIYLELDDTFRGVANIELSVNNTVKTATLIRANMPNAPNNYSVEGHATIQYISDDLTAAHGSKSLDLNHDPNNLILCTDETSTNSLKEYYSSEVITEIKRLNYYDFSVTDGVTWTQITETTIGNSSSRTVYQEINDIETAQAIKIYGSDGKSTTKDQIDFSEYTFNSANNTLVIK